MKLRYLFLALLLPAFAHAQVGEHRADFAIGGNVGWTMSRVEFKPTIKQTFKQSPMAGFTMRYISEKYFTAICGVQMEVNYVDMGWKEVIEDGSENEYTRDLHYIQVPFLMQMGWGREQRGLKFLFEAGPQLGYSLGTTEHRGGAGEWDPSGRPNYVHHQYDHDIDNRFDYGITAGFGVESSTPLGHFLLEARYYYGLADVYDGSKRGYFARSGNNAITVKLNYLFDLHKTKRKH